jgi:hypothetical protein
MNRLRARLKDVSEYVNEDPECPHCQHFENDDWSGTIPSQFGGFIRPCGRHREPRFPKIAANPKGAFSALERQLEQFEILYLDWQALEDQL